MADIVELRNLSDDEVRGLLDDAREELFNLRFQKAAGSLENSIRVRTVRREIAQLNEVLGKRAWAIEELAGHADVAPALADKEWTGTAKFDYEQTGWTVTIEDADGNELASGLVDLNLKRRRTRRARNNIAPVQKVVGVEVAG